MPPLTRLLNAPYPHIPWVIRIISVIRTLFVLFVKECPLHMPFLWSTVLQGSRNSMADMEGPYYILNAPDRQLEDGKAVIATSKDLKRFKPYLMTLTVTSPKGDPVPYALVDWWQADTAGIYAHSTYRLRGTFRADARGTVEVLTVAPGEYGPNGYKRAGHFHVKISGSGAAAGMKWETLTTQLYVCPGNDPRMMDSDFLNRLRSPRKKNMAISWCTTVSPFMGFPEVDLADVELMKRIQRWDSKLVGEGLKVISGCQMEVALNEKPSTLF
ncbi:aromatic compound dioxygenase [Cristinia sonorae]|uniref:Aromatic compound dioxygenase n=1 Tax=Cristinia sonorae TaxID=1940300 RepID=A0A8K0XLC8_9AGAR|nr:aromatic compound dioxygenase [Cristinia sonorae]